MTNRTFYVRAIDSTAGILREETGPHSSREEAEESEEALRAKWVLATDVVVVERLEAIR